MAYTRYYRDITIQNNESEDLTDYQVCIEISDADFFIKADPNNLVIIDGDTILPYWVETWKRPDGVARIWTKMDLPASGSKTIKIYYGGYIDWINQDGDDVFEFFDDFDGNELDSSKWTGCSNPDATCTCNNSILTLHLAPSASGNYWLAVKSKNPLQQTIDFLVTAKIVYLFSSLYNEDDTGIDLCVEYSADNGDSLFFYNRTAETKYVSHGHINGNWTLPYNTHPRMSAEPLPVIKDINKVLKAYYRNSYFDNLNDTEYNSYTYSGVFEYRHVKFLIYHPRTDSYVTAKIDWIYVAKLTNNLPSISVSSETEETRYWLQSPTGTLTGQVCDKNGNIITGTSVDVIVLNKNTKEVENVTASNAEDGTWQTEVQSGKKLVVFALEGTYGEDTDIAGAEFLETE